MSYWKPKNTNQANLQTNAVGASMVQELAEAPGIGATLLLCVYPWGHIGLVDDANFQQTQGAKYIEVEVKSVKNVKMVIE